MASLVLLGLRGHRSCADALVGGYAATRWAAVPSLREIDGAHPFGELLTGLIRADAEINVVAARAIRHPRELRRSNFEVRTTMPPTPM